MSEKREPNPADFYDGVRVRVTDEGKVQLERDFPICDFCLGRPVRWRFPVDPSVKIEIGPGRVTDDDWAACDICKLLIDTDDMDALVRRSVDEQLARYFPENLSVPADVLKIVSDELREVHKQFMKARTGDPVKVIHPPDEEVK